MRILVAYATTEGQTRKIAERVVAQVREFGHDAELFDTARSPIGLNVDSIDKVIVAGSVHQRQHQETVAMFVSANLAQLQTKPTMFLSISVSAAFKEGVPEAQSYVDEFLAYTGWQPTQTLLTAGALRYDEYDYFKEQIIEHVVLKGHDVEGPKGDHEFTDWEVLHKSVDGFLRS